MTMIWTLVEMAVAFCAWQFLDIPGEVCAAASLLFWGIGGIPAMAIDAAANGGDE